MRHLVLGFDFETTGLNTDEDRILEVGAVLWDWNEKKPVSIYSALVWEPGQKISEPGAQDTHHIELDDLKKYAVTPQVALTNFVKMMDDAEAIMGHNALEFDSPLFRAEAARISLDYPDIPVIDTKLDLPLDKKVHESIKLIFLAATHGFLNPFPHNAVSDTLTMCKIASEYDFDTVLQRSKSPAVTLYMDAKGKFDEAMNKLARAAGFRWHAKPVGLWMKTIKEIDIEKEMRVDFPVKRTDEGYEL